jgi:SiaC family regulatory phosphoprotein
MEYFVVHTRITPGFAIKNGIIRFSGKSIPEDAYTFYAPIVDAITKYLENPNSKTSLIFNLEYINSSSKKIITNILKIFEQAVKNGFHVEIEWHFEADDDSIIDLGKDLQSLINLPFRFIEIPES